MTAENILKDINKGFIFWPLYSDEAYNSYDYPEELDFVSSCIKFGYYSELEEANDIFKKACYYFDFISKEELDDWMYGGFRPSKEKMPDRLILCFSANWRHETVVCSEVWCNKKPGA